MNVGFVEAGALAGDLSVPPNSVNSKVPLEATCSFVIRSAFLNVRTSSCAEETSVCSRL